MGETQENRSGISSDSDGQENTSSSNSSMLLGEEFEIDKKGKGGGTKKCWVSCNSKGAGAVTPAGGLLVVGLMAGCALV